jgi:hypothetical protein
MSRFRRTRIAWALGATLALTLPGVARAQPSEQTANEARRLYNDAKKAMSDKKYQEAALGFEAASKLQPHAVALYTAAQAWELAGQPGRAADAYARALATPKLNESQAERSRERLGALEKRVGTVVVVGGEGTRAQLDDHSEAPVPARLHGLPGEHVLKITRANGQTDARTLTLEAGDSLEIDAEASDEAPVKSAEPKKKVVPLAEPAKKPVEPEPEKKSSTLKTVGFITAGAGVAALGGAVVLGLTANDAEDTYKTSPTRATFDHAKSLETTTNIMFVVGGVLTAAGVGLVIWQSSSGGSEEQRASVSLKAAPGALFAAGQF